MRHSPVFEAAKKRKGIIDALKAMTPAAVDPEEIDIEMLEQALKDAHKVGADKLQMPDDTVFGAREIQRAQMKLKAAKAAQRGEKDDSHMDSAMPFDEPFNPEMRLLQEELKDAESKGDDNRVKMLTLVINELGMLQKFWDFVESWLTYFKARAAAGGPAGAVPLP